jgi:CO/xanthine dehydrogenase Mo-binding subunit
MLEVIDHLADELKMDPADIRKRNLIPPFDNGHDVVTGLKGDSLRE